MCWKQMCGTCTVHCSAVCKSMSATLCSPDAGAFACACCCKHERHLQMRCVCRVPEAENKKGLFVNFKSPQARQHAVIRPGTEARLAQKPTSIVFCAWMAGLRQI